MKLAPVFREYVALVNDKALPAALTIINSFLDEIDKADGQPFAFDFRQVRDICLSYGIIFSDEQFNRFYEYCGELMNGGNPTCYVWDIAHVLGHILATEEGDHMIH